MLGLLIPPKRTGGGNLFQSYAFKFHVSCFVNPPGELAQRAGFYATLPRLRSSYAGGAGLKRIKRIGNAWVRTPLILYLRATPDNETWPFAKFAKSSYDNRASTYILLYLPAHQSIQCPKLKHQLP